MFSKKAEEFVLYAEKDCKAQFEIAERIAFITQARVLGAFKENRIAERHFAGTTGYGYDDIGRDALCKVFAQVFGTESAIVSPLIASGTHALALAIFGILRPGDTFLSASGKPYDTLMPLISGDNIGSLKDFGIRYCQTELTDGKLDFEAIEQTVKNDKSIKLVLLQRSRGYSWREPFSIKDLGEAISRIKKINPGAVVLVDNCYGEFVEEIEPGHVGADLTVGSLIKNAGGGVAATGGYIAGRKEFIEQVSYRLTAPMVGMEIGSYAGGYRQFFQGLFLAPHTVCQAVKGAMLTGRVFSKLGFNTLPKPGASYGDIIQSFMFDDETKLIEFCRAVQSVSPVDSFLTPEPWEMPGYSDKVIMAAGAFVGGASIELSCDAPIRKPYIAYLQGGLTYEHCKIAAMVMLDKMNLL